MKKIALLIIFMFSIVLLAACTDGGNTETAIGVSGKTYVFWDAEVTYGDSVTEEQKTKAKALLKNYEYELKFNANGTYEVIVNEEVQKRGNYTFNNNVVRCSSEDGAYQIGRLDGKNLYMDMPEAGKSQVSDYIKDIVIQYLEK